MRQFPRTELYLQLLRQELGSLDGMSQALSSSMTPGEIHRWHVVTESIEELEYLLERGSGWQSWQSLLLVVVSAWQFGRYVPGAVEQHDARGDPPVARGDGIHRRAGISVGAGFRMAIMAIVVVGGGLGAFAGIGGDWAVAAFWLSALRILAYAVLSPTCGVLVPL